VERLLEVHGGESNQLVRGKDGEANAEDENMPASMKFTFETTPKGSRVTAVTWFSSLEAMEQSASGMEQGIRAATPQLDALLVERSVRVT
jgi:hypothetical protein